MPNLNFNFERDHTRVDVAATLRTVGGLNICFLQLPPTIDEALQDSPRPLALSVLRDLVVGGPNHRQPALQQLMPGGGPVLIVTPEYALGSSDWADVDAVVRSANRPIVLVAGFGASAGQMILDWHAGSSAGGTERRLSWRQDLNPISGAMRINGGWCWIHYPGGTSHCIVYLKNVLQQGFEAVAIPDLQAGETFLHLRFNDIDLFPLICADLLQPAAQNQSSPQARIQRLLAALSNDRPSLVVGSLLQTGFNQNWAVAVDSLLNVVMAGRIGAVALCNVAHDVPLADESNDKWRSLSGVFAPHGTLTRGQASLPVARPLNAQGIVGAVVRETHASATAGVVSWSPYNPVSGNFVWRGNMACEIRAGSLVAPIQPAPDAASCEIARFLRRYPPAQGAAPRLTDGLREIAQHLRGTVPPTPASMLSSTLQWVTLGKPLDPDELGDVETISALKVGLHALGTLKSIEGITWQTDSHMAGQLRIDGLHGHILVWRSPTESPRALQRHLAAWRHDGGAHPYLVVFGATPLGDIADGEIHEDRRDDISIAPGVTADLLAGGSLAPLGGDITAPRGLRRAAGLALSHVSAVYADFDAGEDDQRATALLDRIGALFQER